LIPARAGLNAVADPQRRNIQAGTAILNIFFVEVLFYVEKFFIYPDVFIVSG
jgi:hypothetical protein